MTLVKALSLGLTDYQRKIAVEYYINNKTQTQIAKALRISQQAVGKIIKKVQIRVLDTFIP
jgi:DNA-directed RNA polymerase specialized sigma subunit